jgi:hypothetical protein
MPTNIEDIINNSPADKAPPDQPKAKTARLSFISKSGFVLIKFIVGFSIGLSAFYQKHFINETVSLR